MSSGNNNKWILLAIIWISSFFLCYMNTDKVDEILNNREKEEILQKDTLFWKSNSENMSLVIQNRKKLSHEIESLKLGMVYINDAFNKLGSGFNLAELKIDMDSRQSTGESMPVKISYKSGLKNGLDAIKTIQNEYTFMSFNKVKLDESFTKNIFKFDVLLDYKYNIAYME